MIISPATITAQLWPLEGLLADQFVAGARFEDLRARELAQFENIYVAENAWISASDAKELIASSKDAALVDDEGNHLAWIGSGKGLIIRAVASLLMRYPWDLLFVNEQVVGFYKESRIEGDVHAAANVEGFVRIGKGTRILPGVFIEGNVVIGENCKIGPNCYLRGNTAIGDGCHIGQAVEVKNSIIGHKTAVGHLGYVGDSILADGVNFGAGTIISNLRHDGKNHRSSVCGELVDTGRRKFGAIVGPNVHTGINTSIYPGRKIGIGQTTKPGAVVDIDI